MTKKRENKKTKKSIYRFNKQNKNSELAAQFHSCGFFLVSHHRTTYNTLKLDRNGNAIVALIKIVVSSIAIVATSISSEIPIESLINNTRSVDLANPPFRLLLLSLLSFFVCLFVSLSYLILFEAF